MSTARFAMAPSKQLYIFASTVASPKLFGTKSSLGKVSTQSFCKCRMSPLTSAHGGSKLHHKSARTKERNSMAWSSIPAGTCGKNATDVSSKMRFNQQGRWRRGSRRTSTKGEP